MKWFKNCFAPGAKTTKATQSNRARLTVELLENRQLMAGGLGASLMAPPSGPIAPAMQHLVAPASAASAATPLDMTTVAKKFAAHNGPTTLYINFDGWTNYDKGLFKAEAEVYGNAAKLAGVAYDVGHAVSDAWASYTGHNALPQHNISAFQTTTGDRDGDIQDIIYRVSEIFAPFNVQVRRITGDGAFSHGNGNTTIFVGKDSDLGGVNSMTPLPFMDVAGKSDYGPHFAALSLGKTAFRAPNSDPFDIAFVDRRATSDNTAIAYGVAHEAGHTFGLAHVRTDGLSDPQSINKLPSHARDVMSYDSYHEAFLNQQFNITDYNHTGDGPPVIDPSFRPKWGTVPISLQNSYTYLQAVLGNRGADDVVNVADPITIGIPQAPPPLVSSGSVIKRQIEKLGDYDVFQVANVSAITHPLYVSVQSISGALDPVLMVYAGYSASDDYHGDFEALYLTRFSNNRASGDNSSVITLFPGDIHHADSIKLVVGAAHGGSTGGYRLQITDHAPDLAVKPIDFQIVSRTGPGSGRVRITGVVKNEGNTGYTSSSPATAVLIESVGGTDTIVAKKTLMHVAPGQEIALTYERNWAPLAPPHGDLNTGGTATPAAPSGSSSGGTTPVDIKIPVYRLQIIVPGFNAAGDLLDGSPTNNETFRSGSDITAMFGTGQPTAAGSAVAAAMQAPSAGDTFPGTTAAALATPMSVPSAIPASASSSPKPLAAASAAASAKKTRAGSFGDLKVDTKEVTASENANTGLAIRG